MPESDRAHPAPRVSVVIPTKNGADTLPELLAALEAQKASFDFDVTAIDSGSRDGSIEMLRAHGARVESIPPEDFDHGETRNIGIRLARGEFIALVTQDAVPQGTDFLESLVRPFEDPRVAGVYGRQRPRPDCDVITRRQLEQWLTGRSEPARSGLGNEPLDALPPHERYVLCSFDNVCSAIRRSVWEETPFPITPFAEDIAWGKAVIEQGFEIAYEPAAEVVHSHRRSIFSEYTRTRLCHAQLHALFGLATLPRLRDVPRAVLYNWRTDLPYVLRHAPGGVERLRQLGRIAGLSLLSPLAQHHGIRDSQRARATAS